MERKIVNEPRWPFIVSATVAIASTLTAFGRMHSLHNSDSLIPVLVSLQQWTFFYWDQSRFGMLVPLLAAPVRDPFLNMLVQGWLCTSAALLLPFMAARFLLAATEPWVTAGLLTSILLVAVVPIEVQFDWFVTQPYAVSLCLGFAALLLASNPTGWVAATAPILMVLAHWVSFGTFVLLLPCVLLKNRDKWKGLRLIAYGVVVGFVCAFYANSDSVNATRAPVADWMTGWVALGRNAYSLIAPRQWLLVLLLGAGAIVVAARSHRLRCSRGASVATAIGAALLYWLVVGATEWVRLNAYSPRYLYPSLLMLAVGLAILLSSAGRTERLASALPAILVLLGAIVIVHQPASTNRLKRTLDQKFGRMTNEIMSTGTTVVAGDYWSVWPAVFHANRARYRLTGRTDVFGLTGRSGPTLSAWRHNGEILLAIPTDDSEGFRHANRLHLRLRFVERRSTLSLFSAKFLPTPD